jgi:hypothetical protein
VPAYRAAVEDDDGILHVYAAVEAVTPEIQATLSARRIILAPSNQALKISKHYRPMVELPLVKIGRQVSFSRDVILDALLPPQCLCCGGSRAICARRAGRTCGFPFPHDEREEALCAACNRRRPNYDRARAVLFYDDHSRVLLLWLKHGDRLDGVPAFGQWLARTRALFWSDADLLLPVPLPR